MLQGVNTAYGVKGCVSNTVCVIIVMHVVTWFYANTDFLTSERDSMKAVSSSEFQCAFSPIVKGWDASAQRCLMR